MPTLDEFDPLTDAENADLHNRVERFRARWEKDGSTGLEWYLPPPGSRHRIAVLVQVVLTDMALRAAARLPFRIERYLDTFHDDITISTIPIEVLIAEYRLRQRYSDRPSLEEYRKRFPTRFAEFEQENANGRAIHWIGANGVNTPITSVEIVTPQTPDDDDIPSIEDLHPQPKGTITDGKVNETKRGTNNLIRSRAVTQSASRGFEKVPSDESTILPSDAAYQLIRKIGSGAFGEVYEALAPGGIRVAIKRIIRTVDHPASKSERESLDSIKGISHPFLLKTNAYWVFDDRLVIVMELADYSLSERLEHYQKLGQTGVPSEELIPLFEQAAEALDYLHTQNVSHRDVKPENILIAQGYAKVADFGLAHLHHHTMTEVQSTVGTPAYMAPEMWKQRVSLHSDQYSFAATYVRVRLGRPLFSTPVLIDMANSHVNETPNLDPLPKPEQEVLHKALAKNPDHRYSSCLSFARALRTAVNPPPEPAKPAETPARTGRTAIFSALAVALLSALAVGLVNMYTRPSNETKEKEREPITPEKKYAEYPAYWTPVETAGTFQIGDKHYHKQLSRKVGDRELIANLIYYPTPSLGAPFYMLENKVTNYVFSHVWLKLAAGTRTTGLPEDLIPGKWRFDQDDEPLNLEGADADLPVLRVTLPEALLVAEELGGVVPSLQQWHKAAGLLEPDAVHGPAGPVPEPPPEFEKPPKVLFEWRRGEFAKRNISLALTGKPLPINDARASGDISQPWKIRQLVSNGQEWLAQSDRSPLTRITLFPVPDGDQLALVVGRNPRDLVLDSLDTLMKTPQRYSWTTVTGSGIAGFRIVLQAH